MKLCNATVEKIDELNSTVKLFKLKLNEKISFVPGQFGTCMFKINEESINRSYSYASINCKNVDEIEFCIRLNLEGKATPFLFSIKEGESFKIAGPMGRMILPENLNKDKKLIFLATGTGVGPFRGMIKQALENGNNVSLYFGCRNEKDILFLDEFNATSKNNSKFNFYPVLTRGTESWKGLRGYIQDFIYEDINDKVYVLCGNPFMAKAVLEKLSTLGVDEENIVYEKWTK